MCALSYVKIFIGFALFVLLPNGQKTMPNIHFRQGPVNELNNETCKKNNKNMVPSFIGLHGNFFMKFTKWLKMFSSSSFLQLFLIRKNRLQAAPALAMAKVKLYGSQARDTKLMKAISF